MTFIRNVSDRLWNYVSPRKTQQRRNKDFKFKVPELPKHVRQQDSSSDAGMSPGAVVERWAFSTPDQQRAFPSSDGVEFPPSPPTSLGLERAYTDDEGDELLDEMVEAIQGKEQEEWDANEETVLVDDGQYEDQHKTIQKTAEHEHERREKQGRELRAAGWTEDAIFLFQKLGLRGFEPLLPYTWFEDFNMLPADLFTRNMDKAFIKPTSPAGDYHAYRALDDLFGLGGRVRDAVLQKAPIRTAENHVRAAILKYTKWALKDGKIETMWKGISLFDTVSCHKNVSPKIAEERMHRKLEKRAAQWRDAFRARQYQDSIFSSEDSFNGDSTDGPELPTLYGVVACHTIMAFVSYDVHAASPLLRTVAMFDFGQEGYDVWNSLAIAIFVIHCRNRLIQLKDSLPEPDVATIENDPDV